MGRRALRCRTLCDEGDVAEVVQDTFVAAWRRLDTFRGEAAVHTWLFTICSRKIIDSRRVERAKPIDGDLLGPLAGPGKAVDPFAFASNSAFIVALGIALADLPSRQRASWILREVDTLTFPEIGAVLTLSPDAVRGHHRRARATLCQRLRKWRGECDGNGIELDGPARVKLSPVPAPGMHHDRPS